MANPAASIPLTFGGTDLQQNPIGIFLQLKNPNDGPSVRGSDTTVPGLTGRIARSRIGDRWTIDLEGLVAGTGNEVQSVTITGAPTGGTFTLTYSGQTTAGIAWDASAATVQAALEALSNIAPGDVVVRGGPFPASAMTVDFVGTLASTNVAQMTGSAAGLTGGTPVLTIVTASAGGATEAIQRAHFRYLADIVAALFDPTAMPAALVATMEDGSTRTIAARTLPTVLWNPIIPSLIERVSIQLEAVADWVIV